MFNLCLKTSNKKVLNHGFVKLIDCMPSSIPINAKKLNCDFAVVQAARVSYNEGLKTYKTDEKLINYLYKNKHTSPFEMVKFKFHVKAPIFVARQWFRHRMSNYNEISGRYTKLNEELYKPDKINSQSKINKQQSSNEDLSKNFYIKNLFNKYIDNTYVQYYTYEELINQGVSREIARIGLPLNLFTEFYWCIDLHNLLNFLKLRNSNYAQYEIKEYAKFIEDIIEPLCPITLKAYNEFKSLTLSNQQLKSLELVESEFDKLSSREKSELIYHVK